MEWRERERLTLLDERVPSRLGDDEIGPLDNDDRHEVGSLAGVLEDLTIGVRLRRRGLEERRERRGLTHSWPYESRTLLYARESHWALS